MKRIFFVAIIYFLALPTFCQSQQKINTKPNPNKKIIKVEVACGECKFGLKGKSCDLAIRVNGKPYFVAGTTIDEHGDAHAKDGFCNAIRKAEVQGDFDGEIFNVTYLKILPKK